MAEMPTITVDVKNLPEVRQLLAEHAELVELATSSGADHIAAKYWKQRQDARNKLREVQEALDVQICRGNELADQLAAALAVIEQLKSLRLSYPTARRSAQYAGILKQSPASALAKVRAEELRRMSRLLASEANAHVCAFLRAEADRVETEPT